MLPYGNWLAGHGVLMPSTRQVRCATRAPSKRHAHERASMRSRLERLGAVTETLMCSTSVPAGMYARFLRMNAEVAVGSTGAAASA